MATTKAGVPDFKVEVRKWILVSNPSRWKQRGERIKVYSPISMSPKDAAQVPVKKVARDEENSVCFVPKNDIEKDSSKIYEKLQVSRATSFVDAHGVAIVDNGLDDGFSFRRWDKFWIHVGSATKDYEDMSTVPVINLRTFETGVVAAEHVCWLPRMRGRMKSSGHLVEICESGSSTDRRYGYIFPFVVCQKLDGKTPTVVSRQVPYKNTTKEDIHDIAAADRRSLFIKRYQSLTTKPLEDASSMESQQRSPTTSPRVPNAFPTPPLSVESTVHQITAVTVEERPSLDTVRGIRRRWRMADQQWPYGRRYPNFDHSQTSRPFRHRTRTRQLSFDSECTDDDPPPSDDSLSSICYSSSNSSTSESAGPTKSFDSQLPHLDENEEFCATVLLELSRGRDDGRHSGRPHGSRATSSFMDHHLGNSLESISERYAHRDRTGLLEDFRCAQTARLCNLEIPNCIYSDEHTAKHYNSPPEKCANNNHEHCIGRLRAPPADFGDCILKPLEATNAVTGQMKIRDAG